MNIGNVDELTAYQMAHEINQLEDQRIEVVIDYWTAYCLIGALQMALSHPSITTAPTSSNRILSVAMRLTSAFDAVPHCKRIIELGWKEAEMINPACFDNTKGETERK